LTIGDFQRRIEAIYFDRDSRRGLDRTFMWLVEEIGELSRALLEAGGTPAQRRGADQSALETEFADVLAWLSTVASIAGVDLQAAAARQYADGCPKCRATPCECPTEPGSAGVSPAL
jgi:NTP pyrophosphatase (non-canonical NTP hydrolase)